MVMYTKSRLYYEKIKNRSPGYLGLTLGGLRKSRSLSSHWGSFGYLSSKRIRINWSHRLF